MLLLVLFTDHVYFICEPSDVSACKTKCPAVKYNDGKKYTARILALHKDRDVLQEIQRNLEEEENSASFKHIQFTENKLSYSDVLNKQKEGHDASKLYVDPIVVLPSWNINCKDCTFSLQGQEKTKKFFQIQTYFDECEITRPDIHTAGRNHHKSVEQPADPVDRSANMLPREFDTSRTGVSGKGKDLKTLIIEEKDAKECISENSTPDEKKSSEPVSKNQILGEKNMLEEVSEHEIVIEKDTTKHISKDEICEQKNTTEHMSKSQSIDEKSLIENTSPSEMANKANTAENNAVNQILDEKEMNEHISRDYSHIDILAEKNTKKNTISQNLPSVYQTAEQLVEMVDNATSNIVVDQLTETIVKCVENDRVFENLSIDEKYSVMNNLNEIINDVTVDRSDNEEKNPRDLEKILDENDTTTYIAENWHSEHHGNSIYESLFGLNQQKKLVIEESVDDQAANVPTHGMTLNPNGTYTLDLSTLELSTDVYNVLDKLSEIDKPGWSLPLPAGNSTACDASTPDTDFVGAGEESESSDESNGEDYIPSAAESDSEADNIGDEIPQKSIIRKERQKKNNSSLNITLGANRPGMSAPDDLELTVSTSKIAAYSKKHFCFYCQMLQSKLARHLELVHKGEEDVKKFIALPPKALERMQIIATIRKNGNHLYNTDKRFNKGELLVVRRPQERMKKSAQDFMACGNCNGQYSRSVIRHHFRKCTNKVGKKERLVMVKGRKVSARIHEIANELVRTYIFPYMREDHVVRAIRYDKLIILYANKQCVKYGSHQHLYQMVRARIRLLGRFLVTMKNLNHAIKIFSDVFQPRHYDDSVQAVKIVAGFNNITCTFAHPAVASNLGTLLKHIGEILRSEYIKEESIHDQKRVEDFLKLMSEDYGTSVNRAVLETQLQNNRRKKVILPNLDDITKLHDFLKSERETYFERLNNELSKDSTVFFETWRKLAEVTLISLQVFNRRRAGEIERVYLEDFDSYQGIDEVADKDTYAALSKEGQVLARKYVRFLIRGKRGRGVPVLVPSILLDSLLLVRKYRNDAGVAERNPYLFGVPSKDRDRFKYLRACDLLRLFAQQSGAELPSTLRGTQLRKHVATKCISLNLSENQVSDLAQFMGHADKIHKDIYRQPVMQNDIIKISQLLEMAQGTHGLLPSDEESSSEEEENVRSTVEAENSPFSEIEGNENPGSSDTGDCSTKSKRTSNLNKSYKSLSATRPGCSHRRWTDNERTTVLGAFKETMQTGKMPTGEQIQTLIDGNDCLKGREVAQLRTWLHTQKKKNP